MLKIGVDVGGTNTDAVVIRDSELLAVAKRPTTVDVRDGIESAVSAVLLDSKVSASEIDGVMIGTTQFTNAFVQRQGLLEVGVIRIGSPAGAAVPPLTAWPVALKEIIGQHFFDVEGGFHVDGRKLLPFDYRAVRAAARDLRQRGITTVAITCLFSPTRDDLEIQAEQIVRDEIPGARISLSSRIGKLGFIERENATVMNASLADLASSVCESFAAAIQEPGLQCPFFISQNDGTLMLPTYAASYPVLTFASGPTNSMRGAAFLSNKKDALVADIGGTTTDIGVLIEGFPRESSINVDIGGVRTNFRMPDILALGLGGGSLVSTVGEKLELGPESVGFRLTVAARVFGGPELTATDLAVAAGYADIGERDKVKDLDRKLVADGIDRIHEMIATGVERMKTSAKSLPLILVGGGACLVDRDLPGVEEIVIPEHAGVANAIGASIAQVGGEVEQVFSYDVLGRDHALVEATEAAIHVAERAGAKHATISVVEREEVPLAYVPGGAVRVRVKVVGDLDLSRSCLTRIYDGQGSA
jgi:N-methylhydantoinase A/oxoprolinase/acetone carboxylase beta subunit